MEIAKDASRRLEDEVELWTGLEESIIGGVSLGEVVNEGGGRAGTMLEVNGAKAEDETNEL